MAYAQRYGSAAAELERNAQYDDGFDPVLYQMFCCSLELHLKTYIWLIDRISPKSIKNQYGHNIEKLWTYAKSRGIYRYAATTALRDRVIMLVGPYYLKRKFSYFDLSMQVNGFSDLKSEPRTIPTLRKLTNRLRTSLEKPVLNAS